VELVETTKTVHGLPGPNGSRQLHDQRNVESFTVEKDAMFGLTVIAKPLSVIGKDDDDGVLVQSLLLQKVEEAPEDGVRLQDLAFVEGRGEALERLTGVIRGVRLVHVEKREKRLPLLTLHEALE
jgi:hypothetical protein